MGSNGAVAIDWPTKTWLGHDYSDTQVAPSVQVICMSGNVARECKLGKLTKNVQHFMQQADNFVALWQSRNLTKYQKCYNKHYITLYTIESNGYIHACMIAAPVCIEIKTAQL